MPRAPCRSSPPARATADAEREVWSGNGLKDYMWTGKKGSGVRELYVSFSDGCAYMGWLDYRSGDSVSFYSKQGIIWD